MCVPQLDNSVPMITTPDFHVRPENDPRNGDASRHILRRRPECLRDLSSSALPGSQRCRTCLASAPENPLNPNYSRQRRERLATRVMFNAQFSRLFESLERFPNLQRKDWEANQSGADRGIESVLIQQATREVATYALVRLKLAVISGLRGQCVVQEPTSLEKSELLKWAKGQGPGVTMLAKVLDQDESTADLGSLRAAQASLRYYRCRAEANPAVRAPWTHDALSALQSLDVSTLSEYPTGGAYWQRKFETVKRIASFVGSGRWAGLSDEAVAQALRAIEGVGDQTASMVALFWLSRPVPVVDKYLISIMERHGLLAKPVRTRGDRLELATYLRQGARVLELAKPEWPAWRVLSCLYLWCCELGREHCSCEGSLNRTCSVYQAVASVVEVDVHVPQLQPPSG